MIHINSFSFIHNEVIAAYTAADDEVPPGIPVGRQGNAVLIRNNGDEVHIVSRPRIEGDILEVVPGASVAPEIDLSGYF
jgi:hypothetical protein